MLRERLAVTLLLVPPALWVIGSGGWLYLAGVSLLLGTAAAGYRLLGRGGGLRRAVRARRAAPGHGAAGGRGGAAGGGPTALRPQATGTGPGGSAVGGHGLGFTGLRRRRAPVPHRFLPPRLL